MIFRNRKIIKRHLEMIEKHERYESTFEFEMDSRMVNTYQKIFQLKNEREVSYHQKFFHTGLEAVVRQWIRDGCEEPAEEITDLLCRIFGM